MQTGRRHSLSPNFYRPEERYRLAFYFDIAFGAKQKTPPLLIS
jgi:hypothetical protein